MQNSTQMKKIFLTLSTCFIFSAVSFPVYAKSEQAVAVNQQAQQQKLIDDWVDYKIIRFNLDLASEKDSELLRKQIQNNQTMPPEQLEQLQKKMTELSEKYSHILTQKLTEFQPRTPRMQQLISLQIKNIASTLELITNMSASENSTTWNEDESEKRLNEQHDKFKQASEITRQVTELEYEIELEAFRSLQSQRTATTHP